MAELTSLHKEKYGDWAGNPNGRKPDPERCAQEVWPNERGAIPSQCARKRGHGPEGAFCKQHDPAVKAERERKQREKYEAERERQRPKWHAHKFLKALREIAAGHNDPRSLAIEVLNEFDKKG